MAGFHTQAVGATGTGHGIPQLCGVNGYTGRNGMLFPFAVCKNSAGYPVVVFGNLHQLPAMNNGKFGLGPRHLFPDAVANMGFKLGHAYPAGGHCFRTAIDLIEVVPEFIPDSRREMVVAIGAGYTGSRDHTSQPGAFLYQQGFCTRSGTGDGCGRSACSATNDQYSRLLLRVQVGGKK